jgi:glycosyltransferase involved in cell wall biosynthesis
MEHKQPADQNSGEMAHSNIQFKVLFITPWYPNSREPVRGIFVQEHAKAVSLYDDVTVIHLDDSHSGERSINEETDTILTRNLPTFQVRTSQPGIPILSSLSRVQNVFRAVRKIYGDDPPDIIHANIYYTGVYGLLLGRWYGIPVVVTEHSSVFLRRILEKSAILKARFAMQGADVVMPASKALQKAIKSYGIRANFQVVPNVVDTELFYPGRVRPQHPKKKRLIFVGELRTSHIKGMPYLLKGLHILNRNDWCLDVVGGGPSRTQMEQQAEELGLGNRITFHGQQSKHKVAELMRRADLFVLPSLWETMGCVLIEAMATGLPIVATEVGGIPEIVDPDTGVLVPPSDPEALAEALANMLDSMDRYEQSAIIAKAQRYSPRVIGHRIHTVYENCVMANRSKTSRQVDHSAY